MLKDSKTIKENIAIYKTLKEKMAGFKTQKQELRDAFVKLKQEDLMGGKVSAAKLKKAKLDAEEMEDTITACERTLLDIREKVASLVHTDGAQRIETLTDEYDRLNEREKAVKDLFFEKCAEAFLVHEELEGRRKYQDSFGDLKDKNPSLQVTPFRSGMTDDDSLLFIKKVQEVRKSKQTQVKTPILRQKDKISDEIDRIEKDLRTPTLEVADRLLQKCG